MDSAKIVRISSNKDKILDKEKEKDKNVEQNPELNKLTDNLISKNNNLNPTNYIFSGLKISSIINKSAVLYKNLICCVCLEIAMNPNECSHCEILICGICSDMLKINGKICIRDSCKEIKKANKFAREMLSTLVVKCSFCLDNKDFPYDSYQEHLKVCTEYNSLETFNLIKRAVELHNLFQERSNEKMKLKLELLAEEKKSKSKIYIEDVAKVGSTLSSIQKMELYNATIDGELSKFKVLILEKKYPIFEEVSAANFKWTSLHYAMHYGQENIILFILDYLSKRGCLDNAISAKSSDGRCPMLCLLKSNSLDNSKKKSLVKKILKNFIFKLNDDVQVEMKRRGMEDLVIKFISRN